MNKRGMSFYNNWAEILAGTLLVIGLLVSLSTGSKFMSYLVVSLCGLLFGRLWYRTRQNFQFTWFLIILGFIVGYLAGNLYGNTLVILFLFVLGIILSYQLHDKKKVRSVEY